MAEQITFTDNEIQEVADFLNFIYKNAKWEMTTQDALELVKRINQMNAHMKKMEKHIYEVKKVTPNEPKNGRKK